MNRYFIDFVGTPFQSSPRNKHVYQTQDRKSFGSCSSNVSAYMKYLGQLRKQRIINIGFDTSTGFNVYLAENGKQTRRHSIFVENIILVSCARCASPSN